LERSLAKAGKTAGDLAHLASHEKGQTWRIPIAAQLLVHGTPYAWIASKLGFGQPNNLKGNLFRFHGNVPM